jgi:hypothetical protein
VCGAPFPDFGLLTAKFLAIETIDEEAASTVSLNV